MKKTLFTAALFTTLLAGSIFAAPTTRYWDACKPSCGWNGNAGSSPNGICTSCDVQGNKQNGEGGQSACGGGNSYTCIGQAPWAVNDNLAYGFAAAHHNGDCGKCYELTFTSNGEGGTTGGSIIGKKMIIMVSNIGQINEGASFDLMIPGGGVGDFDALSKQVSQLGGPSNYSKWGARYGGFRAGYDGGCGNDAACVKTRCDEAFGTPAMAHLKEGCYWFVDWFKNANNPNADHREVSCPPELVSVYKGNSWRPSGNTPQPTKYTLTVNRNPTGGGTTTPAASQSDISAGTAVNISATPASGYTFTNWTAGSGATIANANSATTTVTLSANATITANFTQQQGGTTYTLTVARNPQAGGTTTPASSQANISAGTAVNISATAASGYNFANWTVTSGTATIANASSANTTVTLSSNATVTANFNQQGATTYTLTVARSPQAGGTTNPASSQSNIASGTAVNISATAASGYTFNNWTVTSGTATIANASSASTTVTLSSNATVTANFRTGSTPGNRTDTTKVEAENAATSIPACPQDPPSNQAMCVGTNTSTGVKNIGYISNGNSATYNVNVKKAGNFTMVLRIALNGADVSSSTITINVNGQSVGTVTSTGTGGWDTYQNVTLNADVPLNAGNNTVVLNFGNSINVDYFLMLGEPGSSVRVVYNTAKTAKTTRAAVTLKESPNGFTAALPSSHAYTSYKLIDLRGKELMSGKIGAGATDLRFDGLKRSVLLLKLEGKGNAPTVVRAVTY